MIGSDPKSSLIFPIQPRVIGVWLGVAVVCVAATGSAANYILYHVLQSPDSPQGTFIKRFDLGHEPSIPAYFSSLLILFSATVSFLNGLLAEKGKWAWRIISLVLLALAIDEAVMFHEMLNSGLAKMGVESTGYYFPWTIVGLGFVGVVFAFTFPVLLHSPGKVSVLIIAAGFIFVTGAIGIENIAANIFRESGSEEAGVKTISHWASQTVEEFFEMSGMALFAFAGIKNLGIQQTRIQVDVESN